MLLFRSENARDVTEPAVAKSAGVEVVRNGAYSKLIGVATPFGISEVDCVD